MRDIKMEEGREEKARRDERKEGINTREHST